MTKIFAYALMTVGVAGETMRLKYQSGDAIYCLAVKGDQQNESTRVDGTPVEIRQCGAQQGADDSIDFELADLWRIDSQGLAISQMSGLCLTYANDILTQTTCAPNTSKWQHTQEGVFKSLTSEGMCLGVSEKMVEMLKCESTTVVWVMERSTLVSYPVPQLAYLPYGSPHYRVTLTQGDTVYHPFVNLMDPVDGPDGSLDPNDSEQLGLTNSFLTFSFEGEVKVTVTKLAGQITDAVVRPLSSGVEAKIVDSGNSIEFMLSEPNSKLSIELDDEWQSNSLLLFADPLETNVPAMFGEGVHYINVGEHHLNFADIQSNEVVYVAGGAWVFGETDGDHLLGTSTSSSLENIKVMGRGAFSGQSTTYVPKDSALISFCGQNVEIEGITVLSPPEVQVFQVNAPWYCDDAWAGTVGGAHVHNVKLMGWNFADGIIAGAKSHVHNVFTRLNDDNVKPMMSDTVFEDNVHWQGMNGWAIMISWCNYGEQSNITVRRSSVIHDDHATLLNGEQRGYDFAVPTDDHGGRSNKPSQASIGSVQGGSGSLENVVIEDIVLENQVMRPFWFGIEKNEWASEGTGAFSGWKIKNIQIMQGALNPSIVWGAEDENQVQNIQFEGLTLWGEAVSTFNDAAIEVHGHMQNVGWDIEKRHVEFV